MDDPAAKYLRVMNRLAKWRALFAGWQLGTRAKGDPESDAVRDTQERLLTLRAEVNALTRILLEKGLTTQEELQRTMIAEAEHYMGQLEARWPGVTAVDDGLSMDPGVIQRAGWHAGWKP
jgi:hypothetical protein